MKRVPPSSSPGRKRRTTARRPARPQPAPDSERSSRLVIDPTGVVASIIAVAVLLAMFLLQPFTRFTQPEGRHPVGATR